MPIFSLVLPSLSPVTRFVYFSGIEYSNALLFNAGMFTIATGAAQVGMFRRYRHLRMRNPRHGLALWMWVGLYAFVGIQMGWMLRPFIGQPDTPVSFFRKDPFTNAYVVIGELFAGLVR